MTPKVTPKLALKTPRSIFDGLQLLAAAPRYATLAQQLRLDNPVAARIREIIDSWVAGDPDAARAKTRTDLLESQSSLGTFHELLLREVLRRKFGSVDPEPKGLPVEPKNPDFGVRTGRRRRLVIFESTIIAEKVDDDTRRRREIMRRLDRISGPWHLLVEWSSSHKVEGVTPKRVEAAMRRAIRGLSRSEHKLELSFGDAVLRATLEPASRHRESIVSADFSMGVRFSPGVESTRNTIKDKAARYRRLKQAHVPFIVSIGSDWPLIDWQTLFTALYGDEQVTLRIDGDHVSVLESNRLNFSGKITPGRTAEPHHRTLSAAWLVRWFMKGDEMFAEVVHFPNPWAANSIRILGQDIARVSFRRASGGQVVFTPPGQRRWLKVS